MSTELSVAGEGRHVFVVDDDPLFRESLESNLSDAGYDVTAFSDAYSAMQKLESGEVPDLLLLDWKMPGMNGIDMLHAIRRAGFDLPVIFLTVLSDQIYEEAALAGGAVDFVEKSRSFAILLRRMALILDGQKSGAAAGEREMRMLLIGGLELDLVSSRARWQGKELNLTLTEFRIVRLMAEKAGTDVRYREIYDVVHRPGFQAGAGDQGYRSNVRTFIKRIRQKFKSIDGDFEAIENYPGFGYRWQRDSEHAARR